MTGIKAANPGKLVCELKKNTLARIMTSPAIPMIDFESSENLSLLRNVAIARRAPMPNSQARVNEEKYALRGWAEV